MSAHGNGSIEPASLERGHEQTDLSVRTLFFALMFVMALTAAAAFGMMALWTGLDFRQEPRRQVSSPLVETDITPPEPRLETRSGEVLDSMDATREMQAASYAWLDPDNGIARIPVDRAMAIIAERGLDDWAPAPEEGGE